MGDEPVHVHVPVTVTVTGTPTQDNLADLKDVLRARLRAAVSSARRQLDAHREARTPPTHPARASSTPQPARGVPLWQPRTGPLVPGQDWRVLRAVTVPVTIRPFLSVVTMVNGDSPGSLSELAQRELIERLGDRMLMATVWLVETLRSTTLDDLERAVTDRFLELAHAENALYAVSPDEGDRRLVADLDDTGTVGGWPSLDPINIRRAPGDGDLLHGARVIYAALPVPVITLADVVTTGNLIRLQVTAGDLAPYLDRTEFERKYLPWDAYVAELGPSPMTLGLLGGVVHRPYSLETGAAAMLAEVEQELPADASLVRGWKVFRGDDPDLPPQARSLAVHQQVVVAVFDLPLDIDTITAARERPDARRRAAEIRTRLSGDPTSFHWGWDFYLWLRDYYGEPPDSRPPGGAAFEYVATELAATGDLDRLLDAADDSGEEQLRFWLLRQLEAAGFQSRSRVQQVRAALTKLRESRWANTYRADAPGAPGALWLEGKYEVRVGTDDDAVLAKAFSIYTVSAKSPQLKPAAAERLKALVAQIAIDVVKEVSSGGAGATTYTPESFGQEVFARAAKRAHITHDDVDNISIERSWRVEAIKPIEEYGVPSYVLVLRVVERLPEGDWKPVGDTFEQSAGDFEANLTYWALGKAGEVYQTMGLVITGIGLIVVAWEAGIIAFLIDVAGGGTMLALSIGANELLYFIRVLLGKAELSWEGFFLAAADGYLMAVGFRIGSMGAASLGRIIGEETLTRIWGGIFLERFAAGALGGGLTAVASTFLHDLVRVALHDGQMSGWRTYVRNLGIGAALGALGEVTVGPLLSRLGKSAATTAREVVYQLRTEGVSLATFTTAATSALSRLRTVVSGLVEQAEAGGLYQAFEDYVVDVLREWGASTVARRVLQLQGVALTPAAERGVALLARSTESPLSQEAVRRLTSELAAHPGPAVSFLEVLGKLDPAVARRLVSGTFGSDADLAAFLGGLSSYGQGEQRAAVQMLVDADLVVRPPGQGDPATLLDRQLQRALGLEARAQQVEAESMRARAEQEAARGRPDRAARMQARAKESQAQADALAEKAASGPPGSGRDALPDVINDPAAAAEFERAFGGQGEEAPTWSVGAYYELPARPDWEPTVADLRMMFSSRSGNPVVFRVQGGSTPPMISKRVFAIDASGRVTIPGGRSEDVFVNVGSLERAIEWLVEKRPGASLVMFEVDAAWVRAFRGIARPEQAATATGVPYTVDVSYAPDQLAIPPQTLQEFEEFIIQGTGRVLTFTPRRD